MGNLGTTVKRFLTNKNTVSLLAIVVCTLLLYYFYNMRVTKAVRTTTACYAVQTIPARSEITSDMVSTMKILSSQVSANMVTNCSNVIGKYASYATEIPQNSLFYDKMIMKKEEMPDSSTADIPDGWTQYNFKVNFESTYGNSIFPKNYIDLYLKTTDENGKLVYGKFIQSIQVAGVKDSEGRNVFETTVESRTPAQLLFNVPEDLYLLLMKAELIGLKIVIVPRNNNYSAKPSETLVSSEYLKQLVIDQTAAIPDECVLSETGIAECRLAENVPTNDNTNTNTQENNNNTENNNTQNQQ